jgi:hypothetical protein
MREVASRTLDDSKACKYCTFPSVPSKCILLGRDTLDMIWTRYQRSIGDLTKPKAILFHGVKLIVDVGDLSDRFGALDGAHYQNLPARISEWTRSEFHRCGVSTLDRSVHHISFTMDLFPSTVEDRSCRQPAVFFDATPNDNGLRLVDSIATGRRAKGLVPKRLGS